MFRFRLYALATAAAGSAAIRQALPAAPDLTPAATVPVAPPKPFLCTP